ncbi:MAG TPA: hypothetical protein VKY26_08410, partial [Actinomycetota bacterium]|nr:hypothetical protein [Actinomycetota bacterium]
MAAAPAVLTACRAQPEPPPPSPSASRPPAAAPAADDPAQGKWRSARSDPGGAAGGAPSAPPPTPASPAPEAAADVRAIPYLQGYKPAEDRPAVVERDPRAAYDGLNLYVSGHAAEAVLMDMHGKLLHRWRYPLRRLWPDLAADPEMAKLEYWRRAYLFPNGDLLAIYEGQGLVKLDARSRVLWAHRGGTHHDLFVADDGSIYTLDREGK